MAKLNSSFESFLSNIEPDGKAQSFAIEAHSPLRQHLEKDDEFKEYVTGTFLYGSYRRKTAVGTIKDVDIVVLTNFDTTKEEPIYVLKKLKSALARYYGNADMLEYQRRSIRVDNPLPDDDDITMTLDVIPAVPIDSKDGLLLVPDREAKEWVRTHPKGHIEYTSTLNSEQYSDGTFVPVVKMMKWWWSYQCDLLQPSVERPKPKGFWIECLTGENFDPNAASWSEHFISVLKNVTERYSHSSEAPMLQDPGVEGEHIKHNIDQAEFGIFMTAVNASLEKAREAFDEEDEDIASSIWGEIFGPEFPIVKSTKEGSRNITLSLLQRYISPKEQHLEDLGISYQDGGYEFEIDAIVTQDGFRQFKLSEAKFLQKKKGLEFFVKKCNIDVDHQLKWKIRNTGDEALALNQLRGEIIDDAGHRTRVEHTKYTGAHYVECYAIHNGVCIAKHRVDVPIS